MGSELHKNDCQRWQFGETELSSGSVVEVYAFSHWLCGRIEHTPRRGYFLLDPGTNAALELLDGMSARRPGY